MSRLNTEKILQSIPDLLDWQIENLLDQILEAQAIASKKSKCRSCNADIVWGKTSNGKSCPLDYATGQSHFKTCPQANEWTEYSKQKNSPSRSILGLPPKLPF